MKADQILILALMLEKASPFTYHPLENLQKSRTKCSSCGGVADRTISFRPRLSSRSKSELSAMATIERSQLKTSGINIPYESTVQVLQKYHEMHGNLVIPRGYRVPPTKDFPPEWHDLYLANTVYNMNWWASNVASNQERVYELNQLGFVWERLQPEYNLVLEALITYRAIHGHVRVPASFVVPYNDPSFMKATWGIPLGNCVHRIRSRGDFLRDDETSWSRRRQLDNLGFVWDVSDHAFKKFLLAVKCFAMSERDSKGYENHHLKIKSTFVVPSGKVFKDSNLKNPYPEDLWGYPLGAKCSAVRQKGLYIKNNLDRQKALIDLGLQPSGNSTLAWLEVVHAAAIYSKLHGRTLDVPVNFVVPSPPRVHSDNERTFPHRDGDDWPWPKTLRGLKLGQRLKDVRLKSAYLNNAETANSRRAQLDALGFVWNPKRGRRKRSLGCTINAN